jgi:hypothetical protein
LETAKNAIDNPYLKRYGEVVEYFPRKRTLMMNWGKNP